MATAMLLVEIVFATLGSTDLFVTIQLTHGYSSFRRLMFRDLLLCLGPSLS